MEPKTTLQSLEEDVAIFTAEYDAVVVARKEFSEEEMPNIHHFGQRKRRDMYAHLKELYDTEQMYHFKKEKALELLRRERERVKLLREAAKRATWNF